MLTMNVCGYSSKKKSHTTVMQQANEEKTYNFIADCADDELETKSEVVFREYTG